MFRFACASLSRNRTQTLSSTFALLPTASFNSGSSNAGATHFFKNPSTCSGARPMKLEGSNSDSKSPLIGSKYGSARMRSIRSFASPRCLTWWPASWERTWWRVRDDKMRETKEETNPNPLMRFLPISSLLHDRHDHILRSHERQLLGYSPCNHLGVHH